MSEKKPVVPRWACRGLKAKIARFYEDDARGTHDVDLLNDVAYTLLARCKGMIIVYLAFDRFGISFQYIGIINNPIPICDFQPIMLKDEPVYH